MLTPDERRRHKVLFVDKAPEEYRGDYQVIEQIRKTVIEYASKVGYHINVILGRPELGDLMHQECIIWHSWHTDLLKVIAAKRMGVIQLTGSDGDASLPPEYLDGLVILKKPVKPPVLIECMDDIICGRNPSSLQRDHYSSLHKPAGQDFRYQGCLTSRS